MSPANYPADLADRLFAFETGELDEEETLQFFADLVASGWAWQGEAREVARKADDALPG